MARGRKRGSKLTPEHRRHLSESLLRYHAGRPPLTDEQRERIAAAKRGRPLSEAHRRAVSAGLRRYHAGRRSA